MASDPTDLASAEYQAAMHRIVLAAQVIEDEPMEKMLATNERAHSVGPILYPGDYLRAVSSGSLDAQKRMIRAARDFTATLADVREKTR